MGGGKPEGMVDSKITRYTRAETGDETQVMTSTTSYSINKTVPTITNLLYMMFV